MVILNRRAQRYCGQNLGAKAKIAVIANDAIGNFVVATPLLQMLRERHENCEIYFFGGLRTQEFETASDLIDQSVPFHSFSAERMAKVGAEWASRFDLAINLENTRNARSLASKLSPLVAGPAESVDESIGPRDDLLRDQEWTRDGLRSEYKFLESPFIGEIFCRLAYLNGPIPRYQLPIRIPTGIAPYDLLISTSASSDEKLWPADRWLEALKNLADQGLRIGLVGAAPRAQRQYWVGHSAETDIVEAGLAEDLRGKLTLPEVVGAASQAKAVLTLDNGILHIACATDTPVVGLFRNGIHRLWAPPVETLTVLEPGEGRSVAEISVDQVLAATRAALGAVR